MSERRHVVVIGGGITGLAAAWELVGHAEVTLVDAASRTGGSIAVSPVGDRLVDEAADSFLRRVPEGLELIHELGLDAELVAPAATDAAVWVGGAIRRLPTPHVLGVPTDPATARASGTLSEEALAMLEAEPSLGGEPLTGDESIGSLIRRHFGDEILRHLVEPLVGGINAGEADDLSVRAVTPQLAEAASRSPSLLRGLGHQERPDGPIFAGLPGGMGSLVEELTARSVERGVTLRLGSPACAIEARGGCWSVQLDGEELEADGVVICTPAPVTAGLVAHLAPRAAELLAGIRAASVAMVTLTVARSTPVPPGLSGVLVPRTAGLEVTAVSIASQKWAHLEGEDHLLRVSVGHAADPSPVARSDDELLDGVVEDLSRLFDAEVTPGHHRVRRYIDGLPQYEVGHLERIAGIEAELAALPRLEGTGSWARGLGLPACIRQGRLAAQRVMA